MAHTGSPPRPPMPELVWDGKYDAQGQRRAILAPDPVPEIHVIERYGSNAHARSSAWRNRLILGENRLALHALLPSLRGQVQLVYIDPPFEVGSDFQVALPYPDRKGTKRRGLAYQDRWGQGSRSYLQMMYERLVLLRDLLRDTGCLFLHCDWRNSATLRLMLDDVFGRDRFVNEIVWHYYNKYSGGKACLPRAHDTILLYAKSGRFAVNPLRLPRDAPQRQLVRKAVGGVLKNAKGPDGKVLYRIVTDKKADDVWDLPQLQPASPQWTGYNTQKHHDLLARVVELGSQPGDIVLDAFCGSGTTLTVAETMGRRWIGCDLGAAAIHIARRRLWPGKGASPATFDVCTLGEAERVAFLDALPSRNAFVAMALRHLGAKPTASVVGVDGTVGTKHVAVSPEVGDVTAQHVADTTRRSGATSRRPLIYLAWGYVPGIWDDLASLGTADRVQLRTIPRAWLGPATGADIPCNPVPCLEAQVRQHGGGLEVALRQWSGVDGEDLGAVDAWAVQSGWRPDAAFSPQASAHRSKRNPLVTHLEVPRVTHGAILVKAWNGFGVEGTTVLALPASPRAQAQTRR